MSQPVAKDPPAPLFGRAMTIIQTDILHNSARIYRDLSLILAAISNNPADRVTCRNR